MKGFAVLKHHLEVLCAALAIVWLYAAAIAEEPASASRPSKWLEQGESLAQREPPPTENPRLVPWVDYTGNLWDRPALTGDWGGSRQEMMDKGLKASVSLTQILQGNIHGGASHTAWYQGGARYDLDLDTGAAGLWPGGMVHLRGETQCGRSDTHDSGALMPVNTDALYPVPDRDETCLSEAYIMQFVAPWLGFIGGKMSPRDQNVFAHDETTQFMNAAFNFNPVLGTTVPLDFLGGGVILRPAEWFTLTTLVLDTEGTARVSGFDTAFDRGTSVYQMAEFTVKPFGQQGHQRLSWTWSDKARPELRQDPQLIIRDVVLERLGLGTGPTATTRNSDWSIMYDFDQYLYTKPGTKDQGFGLFGRFGLSDGVVNPVRYFYSAGLGGKGLIPGRDNDTYGLGYYFLTVSDKLGPVLSSRIEDEQGVEVYYNIAVTPWLHITPNIQVIEPGRSRFSETAVVMGVRMKIDF